MSYTIHTKPGCQFCDSAKVLLWSRDLTYDEIIYAAAEEQAGFKATFGDEARWPRIYQGDHHIGGYTELAHELG